MRYFHYGDGQVVIRIKAGRRPSENHSRRVWVVREMSGDGWIMPSFPEITWGLLKKMEYLGSTPITFPEVKDEQTHKPV